MKLIVLSGALAGLLVLSSCAGTNSLKEKEKMGKIAPSRDIFKPLQNANPISPAVFCADPTAVEYEGRLYVYGTNDHQQFEAVGKSGKNTYEKIKSLVCFSTDDMVNWTYHGRIETGKIAPWIIASWAPSVTSRVEADGLTHFYLYFSNSGAGVGVLTATSPLGPWSDPLKKPLISGRTEGLGDCPAPFDPGVCIDGDGNGWLAFGGCGKASSGTDLWPGSARIVRLGDDMISLAGGIKVMPSPYFFEASELNFINGTYVYTFNNSWDARAEWPSQFSGTPKPAQCSMSYMTSTTPLDMNSWKYRGHYFLNPGEAGMSYSNNHTHFTKFKGQYYILYHALILQDKLGTDGGFRSLCADTLDFDEDTLTIKTRGGTREGVKQAGDFCPYRNVPGATVSTSAGISFSYDRDGNATARSAESGAWIAVTGVDFGSGAGEFSFSAEGSGNLELRLDRLSADASAVAELGSDGRTVVPSGEFSGVHNLFILFSDADISLVEWKFTEKK